MYILITFYINLTEIVSGIVDTIADAIKYLEKLLLS